jgi:hypothetical protein
MSRRKLKRLRRGRVSPRRDQQLYLVTIALPGADPNESCHCPICEAMGIDLSEVGDYDVRPIESDVDAMMLDSLFQMLGGDRKDIC